MLHIINKLLIKLLLLLPVLLVINCSKKSYDMTFDPIEYEKSELSVDRIVLQQYSEDLDKIADVNNGKLNVVTAQSNDFFAEISQSSDARFIKSTNSTAPSERLINLPNLTPYKLIVLDANNHYVTEKIAFSGNPVILDVKLESTYKVVAYTYNTLDTLLYKHKIGSLNNRTQLAKPWIVPNREFYYANSPIYTDNTGKKRISLKFSPRVARIGVSIDVRPIFASIQGPIRIQTLNNHFFKGGKFDLLSNLISDIRVETTFSEVDESGNIVASSLLDRYYSDVSNSYTGNSVVTGYFYTLVSEDRKVAELDGNLNYFSRVNFIGNSISGTKNNEIVYTEKKRINNNDVSIKEALNHTFSFKEGFTNLANGKSRTFTFKIYRGFPYGNLLWSTTNLMHTGGVNYKSESYVFRKNPYDGFKSPGTDYWAPNKLIPGASSADVQTGDPCTKVYPQNEWRLPRLSELNEIFRSENGLQRSRNLFDGNSTQKYTQLSLNGNSIKFYYFGRAEISVSEGVPFFQYYNDGDGVTGEANYLYKGDDDVISLKHYYTAAWQTLYYGNVTTLDESDTFRNVRCVRDISSN